MKKKISVGSLSRLEVCLCRLLSIFDAYRIELRLISFKSNNCLKNAYLDVIKLLFIIHLMSYLGHHLIQSRINFLLFCFVLSLV